MLFRSDANIYNPNEICPLCQETLNEDQPIIVIHCAPNASTVNGRYHSCHAACLRGWWQNRQKRGADRTCLLCNRIVPAEVPGAATVTEIFRKHRSKFNTVGAQIFIYVASSFCLFLMINPLISHSLFYNSLFARYEKSKRFMECRRTYGHAICYSAMSEVFQAARKNSLSGAYELPYYKVYIGLAFISTMFAILLASINVQQEGENIFRRHSPVGDSIKLFKKLIKDLVLYFNNDPELIRFFNEGGVIELLPRNT